MNSIWSVFIFSIYSLAAMQIPEPTLRINELLVVATIAQVGQQSEETASRLKCTKYYNEQKSKRFAYLAKKRNQPSISQKRALIFSP